MPHDVFVDTDVVIPSLLSSDGAATFLISHSNIKKFISPQGAIEIKNVAQRLGIDTAKATDLISQKLSIVSIDIDSQSLDKLYNGFVLDKGDTHIMAGVVASKSRFLITYNLKHYKVEKIKSQFDIIIMTPGLFLQYLRSQN